MSRRLPPLSAFRAFEAVARHASFSKAAAELHVTPAAVSQQVKLLEGALGAALFRRNKRSVAITTAGQAMLSDVQAGFELLTGAVERVSTGAANRSLAISVAPSFASKWLVPRLARFAAIQPDIDLKISATTALTDFRRDEIDVALRFGHGRYPGLESELLFPEALTPMCAPKLMESAHPLRAPDDLRYVRLLHDMSVPGAEASSYWERWLAAAGATRVNPHRGPRLSLAELALQIAIDGGGVVLGRTAIPAGDIAAGRLVCPFATMLPIESGYHLVMPRGARKKPEVAEFCLWLAEEAADSEIYLANLGVRSQRHSASDRRSGLDPGRA